MLPLVPLPAASQSSPVTFGDWKLDHPGQAHLIRPGDLPAPYATRSSSNGSSIAPPPSADARPQVPPGFEVQRWAGNLRMPRVIRRAPNGDIFLAESGADRVRVLRPSPDGARVATSTVYSDDLSQPFGIAFWPPSDPKYVYVANTDSVVRFAYTAGDTVARGKPETVIPHLPTGGHWTRDLAAAPDGSVLYLSIGSASNVGGGMSDRPPGTTLAQFTAQSAPGAAWGPEASRADVLTIDPTTNSLHTFATGLRNCSGLGIQPATGEPWCATNERDGLGDNVPPDYATHVSSGAFYGWPWFYIGNHEEPRLKGLRADLAASVTLPDVLIQPHSAPLGITFYDGTMFPPDYRGDAFVALHGSWNRGLRTGYKIIRLRFRDGRATGVYEDFVTGFVAGEDDVWGRPVGVAAMADGSLLFTEDANNTIWRVTYRR